MIFLIIKYIYMNKRILGSWNNNKNNILPSNNYIQDLKFDIEFNQKIINGISQGLGIFEGHPEEDYKLIKKLDTTPLEKVDFDKINNLFKNAKPLSSSDVIDIGVKKVKSDVIDALNGAGDYFKGVGDYFNTVIDYFKNLFNLPMTLFFIVLLVFVILK